jgi:hypothetical protein
VERFSADNFNGSRWQVPGADFNMVCFPSETSHDAGALVRAEQFYDLKDGRVGPPD